MRLCVEMEHCLPARWRRGARAELPSRPACGSLLDGGRSREERVAGGGHSREERAQIRSGARGEAGGMGGKERHTPLNPSSFGPRRPTKIAKI